MPEQNFYGTAGALSQLSDEDWRKFLSQYGTFQGVDVGENGQQQQEFRPNADSPLDQNRRIMRNGVAYTQVGDPGGYTAGHVHDQAGIINDPQFGYIAPTKDIDTRNFWSDTAPVLIAAGIGGGAALGAMGAGSGATEGLGGGTLTAGGSGGAGAGLSGSGALGGFGGLDTAGTGLLGTTGTGTGISLGTGTGLGEGLGLSATGTGTGTGLATGIGEGEIGGASFGGTGTELGADASMGNSGGFNWQSLLKQAPKMMNMMQGGKRGNSGQKSTRVNPADDPYGLAESGLPQYQVTQALLNQRNR